MRPESEVPWDLRRSGVIFHRIVMKLVRGGIIKNLPESPNALPDSRVANG